MSETTFVHLQRWEYRDTSAPPPPLPASRKEVVPGPPPAAPGISEQEVQARIQAAVAETEQRWTAQTEAQEARRTAQVTSALEAFAEERMRYFREAEREVVQLSLAVARKILERESVLDPDLLAALVRLALERMQIGPVVRLRVPPAELSRWQRKVVVGQGSSCEFVADSNLVLGDCVVETDLGTASFGFHVQLKEIERGMLDLLEARPAPSQTASPHRHENIG